MVAFRVAPPLSDSNDKGMILLVEDNGNDQLLMLRALKKQSLESQVVIATDGAEALDYLFGTGQYAGRGQMAVPALILLDLKLPKVSGLEVLRRIRAAPRLRSVPVVVLTSSNEDEDVLSAYEEGCNSYIRKPIDFTQFTEAMKTVSFYWLFLNVLAPRFQL